MIGSQKTRLTAGSRLSRRKVLRQEFDFLRKEHRGVS
jgi:hypothetical protein